MQIGSGHIVGGKYRLVELLGTGGMGAVWKAEHTTLRQQVAVKLLDARGPTAERAVQRFLREGQIAAAVRHRNVVYISDFGTENGTPYLVMELLDGAPLADRLFTGETFRLTRFLELMIGCLEGLGAVHGAGIIHRDIKPENIFLVQEGDSEFPKVLDFGLSRSTDGNEATGQITREGLILGTPEYISPEQARGSKTLDRRADLYSLGVLLYEGITGRIPFEAENSADLIAKVLREPFTPLIVHRPDVGQALNDFVGRAMARNREERFASAEDMRAALQEAMEKTPRLASLTLPRTYGGASGSTHYTSAVPSLPPESDPGPSPSGRVPSVTEEDLGSGFLASGPPRWAWPAVGAAAAILVLVVGWGLVSDGEGVRGEAPSVQARAPEELPANAVAEAPGEAAPSEVPGVSPFPPAGPTPVAEPAAPQVGQEVAAPIPQQTRVELAGLPRGAGIQVDGKRVEEPVIFFEPDSGSHRIEVEARGYRDWHVEHDASRDGKYEVVMKRRGRRRRKAPKLVRDLDF